MAVSLILAMSLADVESAAVLDVDWLSAVEAVEVAEVFDRVDELMVGEIKVVCSWVSLTVSSGIIIMGWEAV